MGKNVTLEMEEILGKRLFKKILWQIREIYKRSNRSELVTTILCL
jgi:hypothetical protein